MLKYTQIFLTTTSHSNCVALVKIVDRAVKTPKMNYEKDIKTDTDVGQRERGEQEQIKGSLASVKRKIELDKLYKRCKPWITLQPICFALSAVMLLAGVVTWIFWGQAYLNLWLPLSFFILSFVLSAATVVSLIAVRYVLSNPIFGKRIVAFFSKRRAFTVLTVVLTAIACIMTVAVPVVYPLTAKYDGYQDGYYYNVGKNDTVQIVGYRGYDENIDIPSRLNGRRVVSVSGFANYANLTSVTIPNGVSTIACDAFKACGSLTSITFPESVTAIESGAFEGCGSLTSVAIPDRVTAIGSRAFADCNALKTLTVGEGVTTIGTAAFANCLKLEKINFNAKSCDDISYSDHGEGIDGVFCRAGENSVGVDVIFGKAVEKIPAYLFAGSVSSSAADSIPTNLKSVVFESGSVCKTIGQSAFQDTNVTDVRLPFMLQKIGFGAFKNCVNLDSLTIPDSVTTIGTSAFYGCSSLASVVIPRGVTSIDYGTFSGCSSLTSVTLPKGITSIGNSAFYGCVSLTDVTIPDGVTTIGSYAFSGCESLTEIVIPSGMTEIADHTFQYCGGLVSVTIPDNITAIGEGAFFFCSELTRVTVPASVKFIDCDAFDACRYLTIYCKAEAKPSDWHANWNSDNNPVVWGYTEETDTD